MAMKTKVLCRSTVYTLAAVLSILYVIHNHDYGMDESYITYRYADNLKNGYGLVFNAGEKYYGSTAMGFAILLGIASKLMRGALHALHLVGLVDVYQYAAIPHVSIYVSAASLLLVAITSYEIAMCYCREGVKSTIISSVFLVILFSSPETNIAAGHETYAFAALLFLSSYLLFYRGAYGLSGFALAAATMIRPDSVLMFLVAVGILLIDHWTAKPRDVSGILRFGACYLMPMLAWVGFTKSYFGTFVPETMLAKRALSYLGYFPVFSLRYSFNQIYGGDLGDLVVLFPLLLATLFATHLLSWRYAASAERRHLMFNSVLLLFSMGLLGCYSLFRVTYWFWYDIPVVLSVLLLLYISMANLLRVGQQHIGDQKILDVAFLLSFGLFTVWQGGEILSSFGSFVHTKHINQHVYSYDPIVRFIARNEPDGTVVATAEPGALGYKLGPEYRVIDVLGLVSPGVSRNILVGNLDYAYLEYNPEYIIISWEGSYTPQGRKWFTERYVRIGEFMHPYWEANLHRGAYLYKKRE